MDKLCDITECGLPQNLIFTQSLEYFMSNEILSLLKTLQPKQSTTAYSYVKRYNKCFSGSNTTDLFLSSSPAN